MTENSDDLWQELSVMADAFSDLGRRMLGVSRRFLNPGVLPPPAIVDEIELLRRGFDSLRDRTCRLAEALGVTDPEPDGLKSLAGLLDRLGEAEQRLAGRTDLVDRAAGVLDRVLRLEHQQDPASPPLADCLERARSLRRAIEAGPFESVADEVAGLARGDHPFAHLLDLVGGGEASGDDRWENALESVGRAFGRTLSAAVARSKIVERVGGLDPRPVENAPPASTSTPGPVNSSRDRRASRSWPPSPEEAALYDAIIAPDDPPDTVAFEPLPFGPRAVGSLIQGHRAGWGWRHEPSHGADPSGRFLLRLRAVEGLPRDGTSRT